MFQQVDTHIGHVGLNTDITNYMQQRSSWEATSSTHCIQPSAPLL